MSGIVTKLRPSSSGIGVDVLEAPGPRLPVPWWRPLIVAAIGSFPSSRGAVSMISGASTELPPASRPRRLVVVVAAALCPLSPAPITATLLSV